MSIKTGFNTLKGVIIVIILSLSVQKTTSQVVDVLVDLEVPPEQLLFHEGFLYVGSQISIYRLDLSSSDPVLEEFYFTDAKGMLIYDNNLIYAKGPFPTIQKIDLNDPTSSTEVFNASGTPYSIAVRNDSLYYSRLNAGSIRKRSIINPGNVGITVAAATNPLAITLDGDYIYFSDQQNIYRKRLIVGSPNEVVYNNPSLQITVVDDYLYFTDPDANSISRIDKMSTNGTPEVLADNLEDPYGLAFVGSTLYFSQNDGRKISKISGVLGADDEDLPIDISISPNPSSKDLFIESKGHIDSVQIFTLNAELVIDSYGPTIDVSKLSSGLYFVKVTAGEKVSVHKFIKN